MKITTNIERQGFNFVISLTTLTVTDGGEIVETTLLTLGKKFSTLEQVNKVIDSRAFKTMSNHALKMAESNNLW